MAAQETALAFGIFERMGFEEYQRIPALNYSALKHMMRSPLHYRWHADNPMIPTEEMRLGNAIHRAILEPDTVGDIACFDGIRRGRVWDQFCQDNFDKLIITKKQGDLLVTMVAATRTSQTAMRYLGASGPSEVSLVWRDKAAGIDCKGRIDKLAHVGGKPFIVDLKSCRDCQPFRFGNEAYRLGYHIQLAMYRGGYFYLTGELPDVVEIAVESKPPHEIAVYTIPEEVLQQGHDDYARLVRRVMECEESGEWPPALETETDLSLPSYAYGDLGDDLSELQLISE